MEKKCFYVLGLIFIGQILVGCSSTKKEELPEERIHGDLMLDHVVRNASSKKRPAWIESPLLWAKNYGKEIQGIRYFSYETGPKVDRNIACSLARANAKVDIAGEIKTFIEKTLQSSRDGQASIDENDPQTRPLREFVENTLAEKIQADIHGAAIAKIYWEKRHYQRDLGAKRDYWAYTCAVLVSMDKERLATAIKKAAKKVAAFAADARAGDQNKVKKALKNVDSDFINEGKQAVAPKQSQSFNSTSNPTFHKEKAI